MIVGIHGKKRSGKDTAARILATIMCLEYGRVCAVTHYADTLKRAAAALFDIDTDYFYKGELKEEPIPGIGFTPRKIMTDFHDGLVPLFGDNLFVRPVMRQWRQWSGKNSRGLFLIPDVRYDGRETDWIRENGGVILHVYRDTAPNCTHSSEQGISIQPGDHVLDNNGSLEALETQIRQLVQRGVFE